MAAFAARRDAATDGESEDDEEISEGMDVYIQNKFMDPDRYRKMKETRAIESKHVDIIDVSKDGFHKYYSLSLKLMSAFCENVVSHPFIVLRRQCQVHRTARQYHLLPLTLIPIIIKIQGRQGLGTLWKGIGSVFIVKGLGIVFEDVLSKISHFPKETSNLNSISRIGQHLLLKFAAFAMLSPFYSASLVETVQSDIASEKPGIIECLTEGLGRIMPRRHNPTSAIVPIWSLAMLTATHGVLHYFIGFGFQRLARYWLSSAKKRRRQDSNKSSPINKQMSYTMDHPLITTSDSGRPTTDWGYAELSSALVSGLAADVLLYPLETVMNRLHVQGTRTIVDSLDTGLQVFPLVTRYEGPLDCFHSVVTDEGAAGLFKGFGALVLQYAVHAAILKLAKSLLDEIERNYGTDSRISTR